MRSCVEAVVNRSINHLKLWIKSVYTSTELHYLAKLHPVPSGQHTTTPQFIAQLVHHPIHRLFTETPLMNTSFTQYPHSLLLLQRSELKKGNNNNEA